jgi:hypothetical protein
MASNEFFIHLPRSPTRTARAAKLEKFLQKTVQQNGQVTRSARKPSTEKLPRVDGTKKLGPLRHGVENTEASVNARAALDG